MTARPSGGGRDPGRAPQSSTRTDQSSGHATKHNTDTAKRSRRPRTSSARPRDVPGGLTIKDAQEMERASRFRANQLGLSGREYGVLTAVQAFTVSRRRRFAEVYLGALAAFAFGEIRSTPTQQDETRKHLKKLHEERGLIKRVPPASTGRPAGKKEGEHSGASYYVELIDCRTVENRAHWDTWTEQNSGESPGDNSGESPGVSERKLMEIAPETQGNPHALSRSDNGRRRQAGEPLGRAIGDSPSETRRNGRSARSAQAPTTDDLEDHGWWIENYPAELAKVRSTAMLLALDVDAGAGRRLADPQEAIDAAYSAHLAHEAWPDVVDAQLDELYNDDHEHLGRPWHIVERIREHIDPTVDQVEIDKRLPPKAPTPARRNATA